ncbi:response regulator [Alteromonas gilva]|uniref:Response regulator n=1 Tax=Alteromonas gilva TaxID=2987522 RepID=A0ABT5L1Q6_9ALTE|nr:response regulator [Alteromonas gilva]MDC8830971.1 response regulator [Alteromonas gilva]
MQKIRVAIVEDNATARSTIRNHLLTLGNLDVSSFSTGNELKGALRKQNFEVLIFDFNLGQNRNGVEWVQLLRQNQYIRPSTGIMFLTADRLPQTIGQIIDVHPDLLLIKPYTINSLRRAVKHYLDYRQQAAQALKNIDNERYDKAIEQLTKLLASGKPSRVSADLERLLARLLMQQSRYSEAVEIYRNVLAKSDKVLWAQWGKLKCQFLMGNWDDCQASLDNMRGAMLTRDKAFEWLACLSFEQAEYDTAEYYLDHIKDSELSLPATRLKSLTYQKLNRVLESIELYQKKREYNRSTKERFDEFTFELAEFYLSIAQNSPVNNRAESLLQARKLVGVAARSQNDMQSRQRHDYLLAHSYILEDQLDKARDLTAHDHMTLFSRTPASTLITAALVNNALGNADQAATLLDMVSVNNEFSELPSEYQTIQSQLLSAEHSTGMAQNRAEKYNEQGQQHFVKQAYQQALNAFYHALQLQPDMPAFALNMLQTMLMEGQSWYRNVSASALTELISGSELSSSNAQRFERLKSTYPHLNTSHGKSTSGASGDRGKPGPR